MGALNDCGDNEKSQKCRKYFLQYSEFASERPQLQTWRHQTCFLPRATSNLVTPLQGGTSPWNLKFLAKMLIS